LVIAAFPQAERRWTWAVCELREEVGCPKRERILILSADPKPGDIVRRNDSYALDYSIKERKFYEKATNHGGKVWLKGS
jgi:hypothetical protein